MPSGKKLMSNRLYDALKYIAQVLLPAVGTLYFGLAQLWEWSNAEEVVGTITVVDTFLGVLLHLSTSSYNKSDERFDGRILVDDSDESGSALNVSINPASIVDKDSVTLQVTKP